MTVWFAVITVGLGLLGITARASAQCASYALSNPNCVVVTINNEFLKATRLTSGLLVAGPPEVAREIALLNGAMFDAANAATGGQYASTAYAGGPVSGASVQAAVLQAGVTALNGIFGNDIWAGAGGNACRRAGACGVSRFAAVP